MQLTYTRETSYGATEVGGKLADSVKRYGFGLLNQTDLKAKMNSKGVDFSNACLVFDICNPHYAKEVLESNLNISTALPCRISVYEEDGCTKVSTLLPTKVLNMFGTSGLEHIAEAVEKALISIIDEVTE